MAHSQIDPTLELTSVKSPKSARTALLLCIFLGMLGVHRFYVGKIGTGLLMLLTCGGFGIWSLIDLILIANCDFKDSHEQYLVFSRAELRPITDISPKKAQTTLFLCLFLGLLGAHRFYVRKFGTGILMLLTLGGFGIWSLIDLVFISGCEFKDVNGKYIVFARLPGSSTRRLLIVLGMILVGIVIYVTVLTASVFYATQGVTDTVQNELIALRAGDITKAYSYTSKDFQAGTSLEDFKIFVAQMPALKNNKSLSISSRAIENNNGSVKGTLETKDGATTSVEFNLVKENDAWKIIELHLKGSGVTVQPEQVPETEPVQNETSSEVAPAQHETSTELTPAQSETTAEVAPAEPEIPSDIVSPDDNTLKIFKNSNNKYSLEYPADWSHEQPDMSTELFGKKMDNSDLYYSTVNVQTIRTAKLGGKYASVQEQIDAIKSQAVALTNFQLIEEGDIAVPKNPDRFKGQYLTFTYDNGEATIKQNVVIIIRDDGMVFYMWGYTAPTEQYDKDESTNKSMFESWTIE